MWDLLEEKDVQNVPREIQYYFLCKEFRCLPEAGGLLDQDPVILEAFSLIIKTKTDHAKLQQKRREAKENRSKNKR